VRRRREHDASGVRVKSGDDLVAEARPSSVDLVAPAAPSFDEAADAAKRFPWYTGHLYPSCFVCGPERTPGDGLCIHPGAIPERNVAAAPCSPSRARSGSRSSSGRPRARPRP
jgi:hypothetical protein